MSAVRKTALLRHCLGVEGQRVLETLTGNGTNTDYAGIVKLLKDQFAAPQSALLRRFMFRQRHQLPGESVHQYVSNLKGLASHCKFGALTDEMIRDQLIEHTTQAKIRETLLLESDDLTLAKAVAIAFQIESAVECAAKLTQTESSLSQAVCIRAQSHDQQQQQPSSSGLDVPDTAPDPVMHLTRQQGRRQRQRQFSCGSRGSNTHATRARHCPANDQTCRNCGRKNHFAKMCRSAPSRLDAHTPRGSPTIIRHVTSGPMQFKSCTVNIHTVCIPLLLDTGASVSLLNASTISSFIPVHCPRPLPSYMGMVTQKCTCWGPSQ